MKAVGVINEGLYEKIAEKLFLTGQNQSTYVWYCTKTPNFGETLAITIKQGDK